MFTQHNTGTAAFEAQVGLAASLDPSTPCEFFLQSSSVLQTSTIFFLVPPANLCQISRLALPREVYVYFFTLNVTSWQSPCACCRGDKCNCAVLCLSGWFFFNMGVILLVPLITLPLQRVNRDLLHDWNSSSVQSCWTESRCPLTSHPGKPFACGLSPAMPLKQRPLCRCNLLWGATSSPKPYRFMLFPGWTSGSSVLHCVKP